ncbi:hypothetical protein CAPN002_03180 [Capnocytophaga stomatis]|uniref:porin n=1 Tax=Capnocytophaga stomatis TaxID=1848904 RepID=UPI001951549B|nr:porin [Capnocytophaga stomatis]GIJ93100.1 hypothetical protein CAPN002_03180 [Capnocytophaga stomatis]
MKNIYTAMAFLAGSVVFAQQGFQEQIDELKMKSDRFNVYLNFQSSFDATTVKDTDTHFGFIARQLRLEFRGNINERIFYRLRHRLNHSSGRSSLDKLARATDMMYAGFRLNEKWTVTAGKMCQAWGGYEFDLNPMNIYEYSDYVEHMDNFMVGGMLTYTPDENHELNFQVTNSRTNRFNELYPDNKDIRATNAPLAYIFNWNGSMWDGLIQTRWGIGYEQEAENHSSSKVMLGTMLNLSKFQMFFDYMLANQGLDRFGYAGIYTDAIGIKHTGALKGTTYNSFVTKAEYQPHENWNVFGKFMYETARVGKDIPAGFMDSKRNSFGYFLGIEYMPFKDQDLRFFATYVGRKYSYARDSFNTHSNRFSIGMMYRIKAF